MSVSQTSVEVKKASQKAHAVLAYRIFRLIAKIEKEHHVGVCGGDVLKAWRQAFPKEKRNKVHMTSRMNELWQQGLLKLVGNKLCPLQGISVQAWKTTSEAERELLVRLKIVGVKTLSTTPAMIASISWFFDTKEGRKALATVQNSRPQTYIAWQRMRNEAALYVSKKFSFKELARFKNGQEFKRAACKIYVEDAAMVKTVPVKDELVQACLAFKRRNKAVA